MPNSWYYEWQRNLSETSIIQSIEGLSEKTSIDIGANFGDYTIILSRYSKYVISIEPSSVTLKELYNTIRYWELQNVYVLEGVIANENGSRKLYLSSAHGLHSISPDLVAAKNLKDWHYEYDHNFANFVEVPAYKLDTIATNLDIGLIKIDVESAEEEVLLSARETLLRCHPVLLLETHFVSKLENIYRYLTALGYRFYLNQQEVTILEPIRNYEVR